MQNDFDIVVIGSGLAGVAASFFARQSGARVCVVSKNTGASAFFSGAFDFFDDPAYSTDPTLSEGLFKTFEHFKERYPQHFYSRLSPLLLKKSTLSLGAVLKKTALDFFEALKLSVWGDGSHYCYALAPSGQFKPTAFVLAPQGGGGPVDFLCRRPLF